MTLTAEQFYDSQEAFDFSKERSHGAIMGFAEAYHVAALKEGVTVGDYDSGESYTVLAIIGLILFSPLIVLLMIFIYPMVRAIGYVQGWWAP